MAAEKMTVDYAEKKNAVEDIESSGTRSPAVEYDELPDPDIGKSPEERAKLVRHPMLFSHGDA